MNDFGMNGVGYLAKDLLEAAPRFSGASLRRVQPLSGDASGRRYYRLHLSGGPIPTVTLMILNRAPGPVGGGKEKKTQDDTFVELAGFFREKGIRVPVIYHDARPMGALIVEDVGDRALWHFARDEDTPLSFYGKAIDIIKGFQSIAPESSIVAFQRSVGFEQYRREVSEFIRYYAGPKGLRASALKAVEEFLDLLCESLSSHPGTLSHFDFMSHNIYVTAEGELIIIDFQDACMVSPVRDLVSLINDRDVDASLGKDRHRALLEYYQQVMDVGASFKRQYNECLLHWDLRVAGRFILLSEEKKMEKYREWVPGTLRRIGRTLSRMEKCMRKSDEVISSLAAISPEIREGLEDPWPMP